MRALKTTGSCDTGKGQVERKAGGEKTLPCDGSGIYRRRQKESNRVVVRAWLAGGEKDHKGLKR